MHAATRHLKSVVVGDGACGKTCMLIRYCSGNFNEDYIPTVFENFVKNMTVDNKNIDLALWDTSGQDDYDRLRPLAYPDANVVVLCFSIAEPDTIDNIEYKWYKEIIHYCTGVRIVLVGCKSDARENPSICPNGAQPIPKETAMQLKTKIGAEVYVECSAKTNQGINDVFEAVARAALAGRKGPQSSRSRCVVQ